MSGIGFQPVALKMTGWKPFYTPQVSRVPAPCQLAGMSLSFIVRKRGSY